MYRWIYSLRILVAVVGFGSLLLPISAQADETDEQTECAIPDPEFENDLGGGATANWTADGWDSLSDRDTSPVGSLSLVGRDNESKIFHVAVNAFFGPYHRTVFENDVVVTAEETVGIEIDIPSAMNIHEKQNDYVTYLVASVRVAGGDGRSGPRVVLTPRVLAISSATGDFEVLDHETAKLVYPGGIVSPELRRVYDEIVAGTDPNDGVFLGLSPNIGIRRTTVNGVIQENEED